KGRAMQQSNLRVKRRAMDLDKPPGRLNDGAMGKGRGKGTPPPGARVETWGAAGEATSDAAATAGPPHKAAGPIPTPEALPASARRPPRGGGGGGGQAVVLRAGEGRGGGRGGEGWGGKGGGGFFEKGGGGGGFFFPPPPRGGGGGGGGGVGGV